jgi:hypothetical protein
MRLIARLRFGFGTGLDGGLGFRFGFARSFFFLIPFTIYCSRARRGIQAIQPVVCTATSRRLAQLLRPMPARM